MRSKWVYLNYSLRDRGKQCKIIFMNRLLELETQLNRVINGQEGKMDSRDETLDWERLHMASSARCAYILAMQKRRRSRTCRLCGLAFTTSAEFLTGKQKTTQKRAMNR